MSSAFSCYGVRAMSMALWQGQGSTLSPRGIVVCADAACTAPERVFQIDRPTVLGEQVGERLVSQLLERFHAVARIEIERHPGGAIECDALADVRPRIRLLLTLRHELSKQRLPRHDTENEEDQEDHKEDGEQDLRDAGRAG